MADTIKIKRSTVTATPPSLAVAELAYSELSGNLFIGRVADGVPIKIGGALDVAKLNGIEALADVTDATNVAAAGAVMEVDTTTVNMDFVIDEDSFVSDLDTKVPTQQSVKAYVDASVVGGMTYQGPYDAATNTPNLDSTPSGVLTGDTYTVTVAGTFFTAPVEAGDMLVAEQDDPTLEAHWTVVNRNIDETAFATAAQGALADTALQPLDNISELTNDSGFLSSVQAGDVDSEASTDGYILTSDGAGNAAWEAGASGTLEGLSDTTITSATLDDVLAWDGAKWINTPLLDGPLDDLSDVTITTVANDEILQWTGAAWENQTLTEAGIQPAGAYLTTVTAGDVDAEASADGYVLTSDGAGNAAWEVAADVSTLNNIGDVTITSNTSGELLTWTGAAWENQTLAEAGIQAAGSYLTDITSEVIGDLSDVTITTIASGELLVWTGAAFENNTIAEAGLATSAQGALADSALQDITGESIKSLSDVFTTMSPADGQVLTFDTVNGWQAEAIPGGVTTFAALNDTPADFVGAGDYIVKVNPGATALVFQDGLDGGTF